MKLEDALGGFAVFAFLVSLVLGMYSSFDVAYDITETANKNGENIFQALQGLEIIEGLNQTVTAVYKIANPTNPLDVLGSLLSASIGVVRTIVGIVALPVDIIAIVVNYYNGWVPPLAQSIICILFAIYMGFLLLKFYSRGL